MAYEFKELSYMPYKKAAGLRVSVSIKALRKTMGKTRRRLMPYTSDGKYFPYTADGILASKRHQMNIDVKNALWVSKAKTRRHA